LGLQKGGRKGTYGFKMSILGDICRPAVFFGCFGHHRQKDAALQDARTFAKTTKPAPPAGLQTSLNCKVEPLARSNSARGRTLQHQGEGSQSRASGCERVIGCRRQVRDLVFLVLVLQICRADGAVPKSFCNGRLGGAHASRVRVRASRPNHRWTNQFGKRFSARRRKRQPGRSRSPFPNSALLAASKQLAAP